MQIYLVVFMLAVDAILSFMAALKIDERTNLVVDDYPLFCWPKAVKQTLIRNILIFLLLGWGTITRYIQKRQLIWLLIFACIYNPVQIIYMRCTYLMQFVKL